MKKLKMQPSADRIAKGLYWDRAWSLVEGCSPVSPGCENCWSANQTHIRSHQKNSKIGDRYAELTVNGKFNSEIRLMWDDLDKPLKVKRPQVWAIWNDLFHESVDFDFIDRAFYIMQEEADHHTYLLLTKRPERMLEYYNYAYYESCGAGDPEFGIKGLETGNFEIRDNVIPGITAENQEQLDKRMLDFSQIPARTKFLSIEPMLGPIDVSRWAGLIKNKHHPDGLPSYRPDVQWILCGGETGSGARPMHPGWPRVIRDQCQAAGIPFFFKQWGEWTPYGSYPPGTPGRFALTGPDGWSVETDHYPAQFISFGQSVSKRVGKKKAGRRLDGREWSEFPNLDRKSWSI